MPNKAGEIILVQCKEGRVLWVCKTAVSLMLETNTSHRLCSKPRGCGSGAKPFDLRIDNTWHSCFSLCHLCVLCAPVWEGPGCVEKAVSAALMSVTDKIMLEELPGCSSPAFEWFDSGHSHQQSCLHLALQRASKTQEITCRGGGNCSFLVCLNWLLR